MTVEAFLIFPSLAEAQIRNAAEAARRGCAGGTRYWWPMVVHPIDGRAALSTDGADDPGLTTEEVGALVDRAALDADGWFPPPEEDEA